MFHTADKMLQRLPVPVDDPAIWICCSAGAVKGQKYRHSMLHGHRFREAEW
jgi:hypothetical protein